MPMRVFSKSQAAKAASTLLLTGAALLVQGRSRTNGFHTKTRRFAGAETHASGCFWEICPTPAWSRFLHCCAVNRSLQSSRFTLSIHWRMQQIATLAVAAGKHRSKGGIAGACPGNLNRLTCNRLSDAGRQENDCTERK
jgi:hypothetical protein